MVNPRSTKKAFGFNFFPNHCELVLEYRKDGNLFSALGTSYGDTNVSTSAY
jgi:hypothetical protein